MSATEGSRVLLLGECNPYFAGHSDPSFALYCYPVGCAGYRLRRIFGLPQPQYLALHRKNLCDGDWSSKHAQGRARELLSPNAPWHVMVLLGRKVTETFERVALSGDPIVAFSTKTYADKTLVSLPHPSGRNAALWNAKAIDRARQIMREVAPELPWGSTDSDEVAA